MPLLTCRDVAGFEPATSPGAPAASTLPLTGPPEATQEVQQVRAERQEHPDERNDLDEDGETKQQKEEKRKQKTEIVWAPKPK